ncbi:2-oxo acid dehydrogenase subunit E2 [Geopsychrobacter electrodiphilus]|uniref:2-oxo acid dehydrogenase subunit E2 n=1 Tax=Geopsychrobacter electrodiphilus TaxID=225196 RepID=UPI0003802E2C|nr:2-oxo acid dehydrogenase subunit E2 [Geopsychrobacter electrodiphilus]
MKVEIKIPEVAEGVKSGTVVALMVAVGDRVEADQTVLELETDKAVVAIPTPEAGTISEIRVAEGDSVKIGAVIMLLESMGRTETSQDAGGEDGRDKKVQTPTENQAADATVVGAEKSSARQDPAPAPVEMVQDEVRRPLDLTPVRRDDRVAPAAPSVRRQARELGVDIYQVQGTGPAGRISAEDVRSFVQETMRRVTGGGIHVSEFPGLHAQRPLPDFSRFGTSSREPMSKVRELTADAMSYAWSTIPMVTQYDKAQIGKVEAFRKEFNLKATPETKLTMTAFLARVCAAALKVFPQFNSALDLASRELVMLHYINIGVAVDTPNGLLVPVIREVDKKGVETIAGELNELAGRTRERRLTPAEMEGGTFTISNLGGIGGTAFTPIVYAPQVAILGVSEAGMQPVWNGTEFEPQLVMPLSLTYDHRVIDGADGARFLRWICRALENPLYLVM